MCTIEGNLIDIHQKRIYPARISIQNNIIQQIQEIDQVAPLAGYLLPGFIDAHIHIESSMLVPSEFARIAVRHGTVATVSDPHEIANVLGIDGVHYMLQNAETVPLKFNFGAPSCVPATSFETAGATIDVDGVLALLKLPAIKYLSEMMNYPGVLFNDAEVMQKIAHAKTLGKPIDGHAPGLIGADADTYIAAGISTDHECFTLEEAYHKASRGMKILIREGSAAKNFAALHPILAAYPELVMFCSDDKHPDDLLEGHINLLVQRALALGYDLFDVLRAACLKPIEHYKLDVGTLKIGEPADFIRIDSIENMSILETWINGKLVFGDNTVYFKTGTAATPNHFVKPTISLADLQVEVKGTHMRVIQAIDGEIITNSNTYAIDTSKTFVDANPSEDILKIAVVNRYKNAPVTVAFIKGFGLKSAAMAGTVAHDSHNIVAVGSNDEMLLAAIALVSDVGGGLSAVTAKHQLVVPLAVAGLMSTQPCEDIAAKYVAADHLLKSAGCKLTAPFMTLSFMALLVIPELKISDLGLFDGKKFTFAPLFSTL